MEIAIAATLFGVGLAVGFLSGLVGIGGGVLIVPFLYFFYGHSRWSGAAVPEELHAAVAHATSLFVILPTALRGTFAYHRDGLVAWRAALPIAVVSVLAAAAGARVALLLPPEVLKLAFGVLLVVSGTQLVARKVSEKTGELRLGLVATAATGLLVGALSAMLGVGGGLVAIPMLVYVIRLDIRQVAATSLAVVSFAAASGTATYIASGWAVAGRPDGSLGYVHVLAALPILLGAVVSVRWGAVVNQKMGSRALRLLFGAIFVVFGLRIIWENVGALG